MKNKMKMLFPVALATLAFGILSAPAAADPMTPSAALPAPGTNSNPEAAMTALFGDPVIAKGKGLEIKRSQLDELLAGPRASAAATGQVLPPAFEVQMLNQLIFVQLMQPKATDADRVNGQKEADLQFTNIVKRFGAQALDRQLKAVGMTIGDLRARATQEAIAQAALRRELNVSVTDADAREYYTNHPAAFEQPEKARLYDILLLTVNPDTGTPLSMDQQQAKRKRMDDLLKRVRGGGNFTNLAAQYSEDPNSKDDGGQLPPLSRDQMRPELAAAAFSLTNNQISDVIEMPFGYYIVKLVDKIPARKLAFTDPVPQSDTTVAENIKEFLTQQKIARLLPAYLDKLKKSAGVEILDPHLQALEAAVEAAASNAPAITPEP